MQQYVVSNIYRIQKGSLNVSYHTVQISVVYFSNTVHIFIDTVFQYNSFL